MDKHSQPVILYEKPVQLPGIGLRQLFRESIMVNILHGNSFSIWQKETCCSDWYIVIASIDIQFINQLNKPTASKKWNIVSFNQANLE